MIGIYKITNKINGKSYIGQSNNIQRRFKEHIYKNELAIEKAIHKYGFENFTFEILEECQIEDLDRLEKYYIKKYNTYKDYGYNCNEGGGVSQYENNSNTKLTNKDVYYIREAYAMHKRRKDVYELYKDKITFNSFARIWDGSTWAGIHSDVYTEENKKYYSRQATNGELSDKAVFTNDEVIKLREQYVNKTAKELYCLYKDRISFQGFQQMLWGRSYSNLPIYKKKEKQWINI